MRFKPEVLRKCLKFSVGSTSFGSMPVVSISISKFADSQTSAPLGASLLPVSSGEPLAQYCEEEFSVFLR